MKAVGTKKETLSDVFVCCVCLLCLSAVFVCCVCLLCLSAVFVCCVCLLCALPATTYSKGFGRANSNCDAQVQSAQRLRAPQRSNTRTANGRRLHAGVFGDTQARRLRPGTTGFAAFAKFCMFATPGTAQRQSLLCVFGKNYIETKCAALLGLFCDAYFVMRTGMRSGPLTGLWNAFLLHRQLVIISPLS
jgi:hypothetical protein